MPEIYITTDELAKTLNVTRMTISRMIRDGRIKAAKVGRNYKVLVKDVPTLLGKQLTEDKKKIIDEAVKRAVKEYHGAFKLLGKE
jgi:excisionase family DNA binding protein